MNTPAKAESTTAATVSESKRRIAAQVRASGGTQQEAAKASGFSRRWVQRMEADGDPEYLAAFDEARRWVCRSVWAKAWERLLKLLDSDDPRIVLSAASVIIASSDRGDALQWQMERAEIERRLIAMEEQMATWASQGAARPLLGRRAS